MCLERITAIRAKDDGASAGLPRRGVGTSESADHLADRGPVILYVFDHFVAEDQVQGPGRKREGFSRGIDNMRRLHPSFGSALEVIFQSDNCPSQCGKMLYIHSYTAAVFKNTSFYAFTCGADDHFKAALLTCAPHIGRLSA